MEGPSISVEVDDRGRATVTLDRPELHNAFDDALVAETAERIASIRVSDEGHEGLAAFLEKRAPAWAKRKG